MRIIYSAILLVTLIAACWIGFYLGARYEAGDKYSVAQQFRGWRTLASLSSRSPVSGERLREKYELIYYFETQALAVNLENLPESEVAQFVRATDRLPEVITDSRLHDAAVALSSCVARNAPGEALVDCLDNDLPAIDLGAVEDRKAEVNGG